MARIRGGNEPRSGPWEEPKPYHPCSNTAHQAWINEDPVRKAWYELGKKIFAEWQELMLPWRESIVKRIGTFPPWNDPFSGWESPWSEAARRMGIDEPVWHCSPRGYRHYRLSRTTEGQPARSDPLVLDLDGDGVETIGLSAGRVFDHNSDGFAEATGWVSPDDGLLVMDWNGDGVIINGTELFSDQTVLKDGTKAADGFQALAELDSNHDGQIDASDPAFSSLRVLKGLFWEGFNENGCQLRSLNELGIKSINLYSTITGITDTQGNTQFRAGTFEKTDGTMGFIGEYGLPTDTSYTFPLQKLDVPEPIEVLPDLAGAGMLYDLHQAMVRDTTGQLKSLVEQFISADDPNLRNNLMEQILFKWAGTQRLPQEVSMPTLYSIGAASVGGAEAGIIHPAGSGGSYDVQMPEKWIDDSKLAVLEHWFGEPWVGVNGPKPGYDAAIYLNEAYRQIFEMNYADLMAQTHFKGLYDKLVYTWDDARQELKTDFTNVIPDLVAALNNDPAQGKELVSEFARTLRGNSSCAPGCYLTFREHMLEIDPELGWVFDTGGLPVYDHLHQGLRQWSSHIEGTDSADAVRGSLTEGDGYINGQYGNDVIYGTDRNEVLINMDGDALLVAGGGNDKIWAGAGNDILDGGTGNDTLKGEAGNDTYIFRRGSGQDTIIDPDPTLDNSDTIWLGSNLTPDDITLRRSGNNLVLKINDTTDTLSVQDYFKNDSPLNKIEQIQFMDGTVWTEPDIFHLVYVPTEGDDVLYGTLESEELHGLGGNDTLYMRTGDDILYGDEGNDRLYGEAGSDILDGGAGNDLLDGGLGNDTYIFTRGGGQDTISDQDATPGNLDTLALGEGIAPTDIRLQITVSDLHVTISDSGDAITIKNWLKDDTPTYGIEAITFADGTIWDTTTLQGLLLQGTDGNDLLYGFAKADTMQGLEGTDQLFGRGGDDTLDGGTSNDTNLLPWARAASFRLRDRLACRRRRTFLLTGPKWSFKDYSRCTRHTYVSADLTAPGQGRPLGRHVLSPIPGTRRVQWQKPGTDPAILNSAAAKAHKRLRNRSWAEIPPPHEELRLNPGLGARPRHKSEIFDEDETCSQSDKGGGW